MKRTIIRVRPSEGQPRFFDKNGKQVISSNTDTIIDAADAGVEVSEKEVSSPPQFRAVCGNFMNATFVKFPNGKTHFL